MEFFANGGLADYLRRTRSCLSTQPCAMTEVTLLRFALQVVIVMACLDPKGVGTSSFSIQSFIS
ncbi:hypothetical protein TSMEX_001350 [Taenia solium]|eukprot:TsM_000787300 transcript=TsM_000787300 gene=TsM_000787300